MFDRLCRTDALMGKPPRDGRPGFPEESPPPHTPIVVVRPEIWPSSGGSADTATGKGPVRVSRGAVVVDRHAGRSSPSRYRPQTATGRLASDKPARRPKTSR